MNVWLPASAGRPRAAPESCAQLTDIRNLRLGHRLSETKGAFGAEARRTRSLRPIECNSHYRRWCPLTATPAFGPASPREARRRERLQSVEEMRRDETTEVTDSTRSNEVHGDAAPCLRAFVLNPGPHNQLDRRSKRPGAASAGRSGCC